MGGSGSSVLTEEKGRSSRDLGSLGPRPCRLPLLPTELAVMPSDASLSTHVWLKPAALGAKSSSESLCGLIAHITGEVAPGHGHSLYRIPGSNHSQGISHVCGKRECEGSDIKAWDSDK